VAPASLPRRGTVERWIGFRRHDQREARTRRQRGLERHGVQRVVVMVETTLGLAGEGEVAIPVVRRSGLGAGGEHDERAGALERGHPDAVGDGGDVHAPVARPRGGVVIAVVDEYPQRESERLAGAPRGVAHVGRVGAGLHPDALLHECIARRVGPHG
jgi:hypothetical protein